MCGGEYAAYADPARHQAQQREARRHMCRSVAAAAALGTVLLAGIVGLVAYYAIVPPVLQHKVNAATFSFEWLNLTSPAADGSSFAMSAGGAVLGCATPYATVVRGAAFTLSYGGAAVGTFAMPDLDVSAGDGTVPTALALDAATVTLGAGGQAAFTALAHDMLRLDNVTMAVAASPSVSVRLPLGLWLTWRGIDLTQRITVPGMRGLQGLALAGFDMLSAGDDAPAVMRFTATVPNPSVTSIAPAGDIAVGMYNGAGAHLGYAVARNVSLVPGENVLEFEGPVSPLAPAEATNAFVSGCVKEACYCAYYACPDYSCCCQYYAKEDTLLPLLLLMRLRPLRPPRPYSYHHYYGLLTPRHLPGTSWARRWPARPSWRASTTAPSRPARWRSTPTRCPGSPCAARCGRRRPSRCGW